MPDLLETMLRGGAGTTFLLLAVILLRDGRDRTLAWLGALFCVSTAWWALHLQAWIDWSHTWGFPLWVLSYAKTAAFWLFARALFEDGFRMRAPEWAVWGGMVALGGVWHLGLELGQPLKPVQMLLQVATVALAASAAWIAWKGRGADLVEPRRRARMAFVLLSSVLMIGVTLSYLAPGKPPPFVADVNVVSMLVVALLMALLVAGLRSEEMFSAVRDTISPATEGGASAIVGSDPAETRLLSRLQRLMEEERVYRLEGLTIGALASRAGAPEYALRRLINGRLGYRNFNAYLNGWRLADAEAALVDPTQREVPISTIALDAGFSSLGPFNRAFKAARGMTPSEFREGARLSDPARAGSPILKSA